jgi:hypothetical protein
MPHEVRIVFLASVSHVIYCLPCSTLCVCLCVLGFGVFRLV